MSSRNGELGKSMLLSVIFKPLGMLISFIYTPVLLAYLGEESYGIWSTLLSIINWINYFDVGIGNGLRNRLAKDLTNGDTDSARSAVSTAYIALSTITGVLFVAGMLVISGLDCFRVFNTTINVKPAFQISFVFLCINFVLSLSKMQLYATQQAEKVGLMTVLIQLFNLIGIIGLRFVTKQSITGVAIVVGMSGLLVNVIFTVKVWKRYSALVPRFSFFRREKLSDICSIGVKFFFIQIAALILYSTDNIIITQLFGPEYVTPYNTAYTVFGLVNGLFGAFIAPLWSRFTTAAELQDYVWMKKTILNLDKTLPFIALILIIGTVLFKPVSAIWLQKELVYDSGLIPLMAVYFFMMVQGSIYATAMNGMGRINLQLILSVISAVLNIPLSIYFGKYLNMRTTGVLLATIICLLLTNIPLTITLHRYLNKHITEK